MSACSRKLRSIGLAVAAFAAVSWTPSAGAVEPDKFLVTKTSDIVALCAADPGADNYVAAIHFCHGFASGAYQYYEAIARTSPANRFVCLPNPVPTRSAAIAEFIEWANRSPDALNAKPVDSMFRYLHGRYPCPDSTAALERKARP